MESTLALPEAQLATRAAELGARIRFFSTRLMAVFVLGGIAAYWPYDDALDRRGTPLGGDFPMFYVAGQTVADGEVRQLYNPAAQQRRLHELFPGLAPDYTLPYRYPPIVAGLLVPLAHLPYGAALGCFTLLSCLAWVAATALLVRCIDDVQLRRSAWALAMGFPLAWEVVLGGQASHFALLIAVATMVLLKQGRHVAAGLVLGAAIYKPNVLALFVLGCVLRYPRMLLGVAITGAVALAGSWLMVGTDGLLEYFQYASQLAVARWELETPPWKVPGLGAWLALVVPGHERIVLLALGFIATALIAWKWRRAAEGSASFEHYATLLLVTNALANPYVPIYDLILLLPVALVVLRVASEAPLSRGMFALANGALLLLAVGPHLSQSVTKSTLAPQWFPVLLLAGTVVGQVLRIRTQARTAA